MTLEELIKKVVRYMNERGMFDDVKKNFNKGAKNNVQKNRRTGKAGEKR